VSSANSGTLKRQTISEATLLSALNGGKGVTLGDIRVIDSDGVNKSADLNSPINEPKTVGDIIDAINALGNGVEARINDTGDGVLVVDTADGDKLLTIQDISGNIAASLNLTRTSKTVDIEGEPTQVIDGTVTHSVDLSDLGDSEAAVTLDSLNGGSGVAKGYFIISDSFERTIAINLAGADADVTTVEQLIDRINQYAEDRPGGFSATARLNDAGTGIQLEDVGDGPETLTVREGNSSTAADLKLLKDATTTGGTQIINGAGLFSAADATATGLDALVDRINALGAGVTASKVFDGVGYRLSILSNATGAANELLIDAGESGLVFEEASQAQDALLLYGNFNSPGAGLLLSSPDNNFPAAVGNVNLTVLGDSEAPVTVTVAQTDAGLVDAVEDLVDSYNALRADLGKLTAFDPEALTTGLLFGTNEALQIDLRMSRVLTDRYFGLGSFQSLAELGLTVAQDGTLELDKARLQEAFEADPEGVEQFFTNPDVGVAKKISDAIDRLAGAEDSLLANRSDALADTIEANQDRLDKLAAALERQRERLTLQFVQLEQFVARMQSSLSALQNLQVLPPLTSTSTQ
jgi:flagellar hook-associated protein 2